MNRISLKIWDRVEADLAGETSTNAEIAFADVLCLLTMALRQKTWLDKLASLFSQKDLFPFEEEIYKILANPQNRMSVQMFYHVGVLVVEVQFFAKADGLINKVELKYFGGERQQPVMSFYSGQKSVA